MAYSRETWTFANVVNFLQQVSLGGRILTYGFFHRPLTDNIVAFATGGQASATQLGNGISIVTTVGSENDSVLLTTPIVGGLVIEVYNAGANNLAIFPASGHNIIEADGNDLGVNTAYILAPNTWAKFVSRSETTWLERT